MTKLVGRTVEDEEYGQGTIVKHENGMVSVQMDSPSCGIQTIPESKLSPNYEEVSRHLHDEASKYKI